MSTEHDTQRARRDDPKRIRKDLPLLWIEERSVGAIMKRKPNPAVLAADDSAGTVVDRIETELHGEASRYRSVLWACVAVGSMPFFLAGFLWSGLYWLPVRIYWVPFERGHYGLPLFSLYEWFGYLLLAMFFAYSFALISESRSATSRLSADYHRLADADADRRESYARAVATGGLARTSLILSKSREFAAYAPLLAAADTSLDLSAEEPAS